MLIRITLNSVLVRHVVHSYGDVVDTTDEVARRLVERGHAVAFATPATPAPADVESADLPPGPESADAPPSRRRKGV